MHTQIEILDIQISLSLFIYIYIITISLSVCLSVCSCLFTGLTAAPINLIFGMHTYIRRDCTIGYMILTFQVSKGHFRSNKFLFKVTWLHCHTHFHVVFITILIFKFSESLADSLLPRSLADSLLPLIVKVPARETCLA